MTKYYVNELTEAKIKRMFEDSKRELVSQLQQNIRSLVKTEFSMEIIGLEKGIKEMINKEIDKKLEKEREKLKNEKEKS